MTPNIDAFFSNIVAEASRRIGGGLMPSSARWIDRPDGKSDVADATLALLVDGRHRRDDVVILIANSRFPAFVLEAVEKLKNVCELLQPEAAKHILSPLVTGEFSQRSYAVFPRLKTFSGNRGVCYLEKRLVAPHVLSWLIKLAEQSKCDCVDEASHRDLFEEPLEYMSQSADMPKGLRQAASQQLSARPAALFTIIEHGDLWAGNVLFRPRGLPFVAPALGEFSVIDWRGARLDGAPFIDLIRFCLSVRPSAAPGSRHAVECYRQALGISREQVGFYALAALGRLGMQSEEFPRDRYLELVERVFGFLETHGYAYPKVADTQPARSL